MENKTEKWWDKLEQQYGGAILDRQETKEVDGALTASRLA